MIASRTKSKCDALKEKLDKMYGGKTKISTAQVDADKVEVVEEEKANRQMPKNRRYVGSRETTAYVLYDIAQSFNLGSKGTYFITDVLVIALRWQTIISAVLYHT